jgi:hypothetical protein
LVENRITNLLFNRVLLLCLTHRNLQMFHKYDFIWFIFILRVVILLLFSFPAYFLLFTLCFRIILFFWFKLKIFLLIFLSFSFQFKLRLWIHLVAFDRMARRVTRLCLRKCVILTAASPIVCSFAVALFQTSVSIFPFIFEHVFFFFFFFFYFLIFIFASSLLQL